MNQAKALLHAIGFCCWAMFVILVIILAIELITYFTFWWVKAVILFVIIVGWMYWEYRKNLSLGKDRADAFLAGVQVGGHRG